MLLVSTVVSTILITLLSAWYDSDKIIIDHRPRWILRVLLTGVLSLFILKIWILLGAIFYLLFDYSYNYFRGNEWNYIGKTAEIDKLWRKYGGWKSQLTLKIVFLIIGVWINL